MKQSSYRIVYKADLHDIVQLTMLRSIRELPSMVRTALFYLGYARICN